MAQNQKYKPTKAQRDALRRKTSFGVLFVRSKAITEAAGARGWTKARNAGSLVTLSVRRFGTAKEASIHGKRFKRLEGHQAFYVVLQDAQPNAWVNLKTGRTNPLIGQKRTNRR